MKVQVSPQGGFTVDLYGVEWRSSQRSDLIVGMVLSWGRLCQSAEQELTETLTETADLAIYGRDREWEGPCACASSEKQGVTRNLRKSHWEGC